MLAVSFTEARGGLTRSKIYIVGFAALAMVLSQRCTPGLSLHILYSAVIPFWYHALALVPPREHIPELGLERERHSFICFTSDHS